MLKFLAGPVLLGAGYIAGSVYGADAEQVVQKSPAETYAAVETALGNLRQSGTTFFDGGTPVSYELKVAHLPDRKLTVVLLFAGQEAPRSTSLSSPGTMARRRSSPRKSMATTKFLDRSLAAPTNRALLTLRTGCSTCPQDPSFSNSRHKSSGARRHSLQAWGKELREPNGKPI